MADQPVTPDDTDTTANDATIDPIGSPTADLAPTTPTAATGSDTVTAAEVETVAFSRTFFRRGYDAAEVDQFLDRVITTLQKEASRSSLTRLMAIEAPARPPITTLTPTPAAPADGSDAVASASESATHLLEMAEQVATDTILTAEADAAALLADAETRAAVVRNAAEADVAKARDLLDKLTTAVDGTLRRVTSLSSDLLDVIDVAESFKQTGPDLFHDTDVTVSVTDPVASGESFLPVATTRDDQSTPQASTPASLDR